MRRYDYLGRNLDVRENVKFFGGHLPAWIHQNFPRTVCALAIEVKKFFMDEWTGQLDADKHQAIGQALAQAAAGAASELENGNMPNPAPKQDGESLAAAVIAQLAKDKRVRMELPGGGRLQLDRRLPFLCVYRRPADADPGTEELVTSEMAYMVIPAEARPASQALQLLRAIVEQLAKHFGAFLLVEIWSAPLGGSSRAGRRRERFGRQRLAPIRGRRPDRTDSAQNRRSALQVAGQELAAAGQRGSPSHRPNDWPPAA